MDYFIYKLIRVSYKTFLRIFTRIIMRLMLSTSMRIYERNGIKYIFIN
ncbi:hypothetical protein BACCOPRO_02417 [Phocaeicola coprophilus DSM 18228 = JCM 13818]|uniref:Uncharacterized protein n=1 Tax=Phocaeicola coprophilus DSM 18228 = JCM 13818 TaxID=547042 RepID=S0FE25_9BACT|nr:hypothetical protein BACCOPRO_02417 [Phocaeicola coprophilus DSM 18228 = JCM 13818]